MTNLPVFPLPNHVVLPHINMPYRLFEERYKSLGAYLVEHQEDGLFIPCLSTGWESDYEGQPAFEAYAVHCSIDAIEAAPSGDFALIITGGERYQLTETKSDHAFRFADAEKAPIQHDISEGALQQSLLGLATDFRSTMGGLGAPVDQLKQFLDNCKNSCELLNKMAHLLFSDPQLRQQFLNSNSISEQLALLRVGLGHRQCNDVSMN